MITIKRDESTVIVDVENGPLGSTYSFTFACNNKWYAELLRLHFTERLGSRIEEVRREEYERGWNDHKKRKPKANWFYSILKLNGY
jgi:hypothetical protein